MTTSLTADERETVCIASDADDFVRIDTTQRATITRLRNSPAFTETGCGQHGLTEWATFTIPSDRWSPAGVRHTRNPSTAQREASAERMRSMRTRS